jgi:molecular chaperone DnaJ
VNPNARAWPIALVLALCSAGCPDGAASAPAPDFDAARAWKDLVHQVEITAIDAMLGASVKVPSHEGQREIELPSGTQHGTQYVLREHGLPGSNGGPHGDMIVVVHVLIPSDLSEDQAEIARKLGDSLEARNLKSSRGEDDGFFSRVRRAFG